MPNLIQEVGLIDLHACFHGTENEPNTYARGKRRIDFIHGTPGTLAAVTAVGFEAFGDSVDSDHRGAFVDINLVTVLRGAAVDLAPMKYRKLKSKDPKMVKKYRGKVLDYFDQHNVDTRIEELNNLPTTTDQDPNFTAFIEKLDRDVTRAMLSAEKSTGRNYPLPWSPTLMELRRLVLYWKLWVRQLRTSVIYTRRRTRLANQLDDDELRETERRAPPSLAEAKRELRQAQKEHRKIIRDAKKARADYLEERAEAEAIAKNLDKEAVIKRIKAAEESSEDFQCLRVLMGKTKSGSIQRLLIPTDIEGEYESIFDPERITQLLIERNRKHFGQAQGTPLTCEPITELMGWDATGEAADAILDGTFDIDSIDTTEAMKAILRGVRRDKYNAPPIAEQITTQDFIKGFKKWDERTSTSPSGRHLSHYKALLAYDKRPPKDDEGNQPPSDGERIFDTITSIANRALQAAYPLERWRTIVNVMFEKILGFPMIKRLRVIHLYEADCNLSLGIVYGLRLEKQAEKLGALGQEQWACPGKQCIDAVLLKELTYLLSQLTRTPLGTLDKDATACFDRIVATLVNLRGRQLGLSERQAKFLANFLSLASYALKTSLGIADERYTHCDEHPIFGTGQGAKDSPPAWNIESTLLMELKGERDDGVYFCDPVLDEKIQRTIDGFVDDMTGWANRFLEDLASHITDYQSLLEDLQNAGQWWEELLHASGGKLELPKCFFYLVVWLFDKEGRPYTASNEELDVELSLTQSEDGQVKNIKQKDCTVSHRTLGCHINPLGAMKTENNKLKAKGRDFARNMSSAPVNRRVARRAYQSVYLGKMGWNLAVTSLTRPQLANIQSAPINALLPAMGYNRNMPRAVVFGPSYLGGIGLRHLYIEQGSKQIMACIRHLRHRGPVGRMLKIAMQWFQHLIGVSFSAFEKTKPALPHAEGAWFLSLRRFLNDSVCQLQVIGIHTVQCRRQYDRVLMDDAIKSGFSNGAIQGINRVRLFLQVECLSDICTPDGKRLEANLLDEAPTLPSRTHKLWPRQGPPGPKSREAWKMFLLNTYCGGTNGRLVRSLGPWTSLHKRTWPHQYDPTTNRIAIQRQARRDKRWKFYKVRESNRCSLEILPGVDELGEFPSNSVPVQPLGNNRFTSPDPITIPPAPVTSSHAKTWPEFLSTLPAWEHDLLKECTECDDCTDPLFLELQWPSTIYVVSDGGQIGVHGSYGLVIGTERKCIMRRTWHR